MRVTNNLHQISYIMRLTGLNLLQLLFNFSQINQIISRVQNFIALNLKEKSMSCAFFSKRKQ
jgi:hypothetical protein